MVTDELGRVRTAVRYEPYGRVRFEGGSTGLEEDYEYGAVDRLFNGKLRQRAVFGAVGGAEEIEGYDYGARVYFPELGRWGSADSVTPDLVWEANPFEYVRGNPLRYVDPDGRCSLAPSITMGVWGMAMDCLSLWEGIQRLGVMYPGETAKGVGAIGLANVNPAHEVVVAVEGYDPMRGEEIGAGERGLRGIIGVVDTIGTAAGAGKIGRGLKSGFDMKRLFKDLPAVRPRSSNRVEPIESETLGADGFERVVVGETYVYVVDASGALKVAVRGSAGKSGVKHTQLTGGEPAKAAGEMVFDSEGGVVLNSRSGRYSRQAEQAVQRVSEALERSGLNPTIVQEEL